MQNLSVEYRLCEAESVTKHVEEQRRQFERSLLAEQRVSQVLRRENRQLRRKCLSLGNDVTITEQNTKIENAVEEAIEKYGGFTLLSARLGEQLFELDCEVSDLFGMCEQLKQVNEKLESELAVSDSERKRTEVEFFNLKAELQSMKLVQRYVSENVGVSENPTTQVSERVGATCLDRDSNDLTVLFARSADVFESLSARVQVLEGENQVLDAALRDAVDSTGEKEQEIQYLLHAVSDFRDIQSSLNQSEQVLLEERERRCRVELEYFADTYIFNVYVTYFVPRVRALELKQSSDDVRVVFEACEAAKREGKLASMMLKERSFIDESRVTDAISNKHSQDIEGLRRTNKELHLHNSVLQRSCEEWRKQSEIQVQESTDEIERVRSSLSLQLSLAHVGLDEQNARVRELSNKTSALEKDNRQLRSKVSQQFAGFDAFTQTFEDDWANKVALEAQRQQDEDISRLESQLSRKDLEFARLEGAVQGMESELEGVREKLKFSESLLISAERDRSQIRDELVTSKALHVAAVDDIKRGVMELSNREREIIELRQHMSAAEKDIDLLEAALQKASSSHSVLQEVEVQQRVEEIEHLRAELYSEQAEKERMRKDIEELQQLLADTGNLVSDVETPQRSSSIQTSSDFFSPMSPPSSSEPDGSGLLSVWSTLLDRNSFEFLATGSPTPHDFPTLLRYIQWLQGALLVAQEIASRQDIELTSFKGMLEFSPQRQLYL